MIHYLFILILSIAIELIYFRIANHFNIIDKPNLRSSHTRITLRGGGVLFYVGIILYVFFFGFHYPWFLLGLTFICVISFVDDVCSVANRYRVIVHFIAIFLMFYQWGIFSVEYYWYIIPAIVLCTGIINAYNFMDGINGITGGYSISILIPLILIDAKVEFIDMHLLVVTLLSVLVFCFFNFRKKAKCFAGDIGSVSIAFILLFVLGSLIIATQNVLYLLFLVVYGVDTILTICYRLLLRENIFQAHRKHVYQLLANELKIPHVAVSALYAVIQLLISLGFLYLPVNEWWYVAIVIIILMTVYVIINKKYYYLHKQFLANSREFK